MAAHGEAEFLSLRRVVVAEPQTGEAMRILALEIYDDGSAIRWALPGGGGPLPASPEAAGPGLNPSGFIPLLLRDDVGTLYYYAGMLGGTAHGAAGVGISFYTPAIPDKASWLEVLVGEGFVRFELELTE